MRTRVRLAVLALAVAFGAGAAEAHVPHDEVLSLAFSPAFDRDGTALAYVRSALFRTSDGGATWAAVAFPDPKVTAIAFAPGFPDDSRVFAASRSGILRSEDGGQSWLRLPGPSPREASALVLSPRFSEETSLLVIDGDGMLHTSRDAGESWTAVDLGSERASASAWSPSGVFVGTRSGGVFESRDEGRSFSRLARTHSGAAVSVVALADPESPEAAIFLGTDGGGVEAVHRDGDELSVIPAGLPAARVTDLVAHRSAAGLWLGATTWDHALHVSTDGGATWQQRDRGLRRNIQADVYEKPHFTDVVIASDGTLMVGGFCGVFRSVDGGSSWVVLETQANRQGVGLAVAPLPGGRVLLGVSTYTAGVYFSEDSGRTWRAEVGQLASRAGALVVSPGFPERGFALTGSFNVIFRLEAGARKWRHISIEGPDPERAMVEGFRRRFKFRFIIAWAMSPDIDRDGIVLGGGFPNGILRSTDAGDSFDFVWDTNDAPVQGLVVSPAFSEDGTAFSVVGNALYRSVDHGVSWQAVGGDSLPRDAHLVISPDFPRDRTLYASGEEGLYRSRDAGRRWTRLVIGEAGSSTAITALAISPDFAADHQLLAQMAGEDLWLVFDRPQGLEAIASKSARQGYRFVHNAQRDRGPLLVFSPRFASDRTVFGLAERDVLRSNDAGRTWERLAFPLRYEAENAVNLHWVSHLSLEGDWERFEFPGASGRGALRSNQRGSRARFDFSGTEVRVLAGPSRQGRASFRIDGGPAREVEWRSLGGDGEGWIFTAGDLAPGLHQLEIEVLSEASWWPFASGPWVDIDALEVSH